MVNVLESYMFGEECFHQQTSQTGQGLYQSLQDVSAMVPMVQEGMFQLCNEGLLDSVTRNR